jgi:hypothetical protein
VGSQLAFLANQFGLMQQQIVDQFTRALLLMVERCGELQRGQLGLIHEELEQLRQATREVQALQTQVAKLRPEAAAPLHQPAAALGLLRPNGRGSARPAPGTLPGTAPSPLSGGAPNGDIHAELSERIERLQEERQGRLQTVLQLLSSVMTS